MGRMKTMSSIGIVADTLHKAEKLVEGLKHELSMFKDGKYYGIQDFEKEQKVLQQIIHIDKCLEECKNWEK